MASHISASVREHTPHANQTIRTADIVDALTRRAQAVLNDKSIDAQSRAIIRYALETHDPGLSRLVCRAEKGEEVIDDVHAPEQEKIETLVEMICGGGDQSAAALLVLMGKIQSASHPQAVANTAKHLAFTRCGELNFRGMVEAQIAVLESELLRE